MGDIVVSKKQNVLFLSRTMGMGGTENVMLQMCEILKLKVDNIVVCSCGGINESKLKELGIRHYIIPDITEKNPITMYKTWKEIRRIVQKEKITLIHSHHRMAAFYAQLVRKQGTSKVANAHNTFYDKKILTKFAYKNTYLIAVGEQVKKNLIDVFSINSKQITVIHNSVKEFDQHIVPLPEIQSARNDGKILIGNIGRLSEQKGMEYYIKSIGLINSKYSNLKFFIIGDGEDADKLKILGKNELLDGVLEFLGYRADVQNIMSQLDFIVLSSLWEGFPLTPIEAFSVGKPIIATAVDGTVEIISNAEDGILIPPRDEGAIADKIEYLIRNPDKAKQFGENGYNKYLKDFSKEKFANNVIEFYKSIK